MDFQKLRDGKEAVRTLIKMVGEDPDREGLADTPERVVKAWATEMFNGYRYDAAAIAAMLTTFRSNADQMVIIRDIDFVSCCEHHLMPFVGTAHVGYMPNGQVVGLSKVPRLVDVYARRMQIQERLTRQIATKLAEVLQPRGVGVVLEASHTCLTCRGAMKPNTVMTTSALTGLIRDDEKTRAEFFNLIRGIR